MCTSHDHDDEQCESAQAGAGRRNFLRATALLGRPWAIRGEVAHGDKRGRTIGFPTANLAPDNEIIPQNGVYATRVRLFPEDAGARPGATSLPAVTNIGTRPTFAPGRVLVETHLLDFAGDLYGRRLELEFHARIRAERHFSGPQELAAQIALDAERARELLRGASSSA